MSLIYYYYYSSISGPSSMDILCRMSYVDRFYVIRKISPRSTRMVLEWSITKHITWFNYNETHKTKYAYIFIYLYVQNQSMQENHHIKVCVTTANHIVHVIVHEKQKNRHYNGIDDSVQRTYNTRHTSVFYFLLYMV